MNLNPGLISAKNLAFQQLKLQARNRPSTTQQFSQPYRSFLTKNPAKLVAWLTFIAHPKILI